MTGCKAILLGGVAAFVAVPALAADLPLTKAQPIEYVRVCNTYGLGFFYIPGTDTCVRLSGRARFEYGYQPPLTRAGGTAATPGGGDYSGTRTTGRINLDARTATDFGTLRAFIRVEGTSTTGIPKIAAAPSVRIGNAVPAFGVDGYGRVFQGMVTDKAFVQLGGLTAGRASSFYDFYAGDYEIISATLGAGLPSTNLLAYTATIGNGFSATLSMEDPSFRRTPLFSAQTAAVIAASTGNSTAANYAQTTALTPVFAGYTTAGLPSGVGFVDMVERNRMPDFVGVLRYDQAWGSAQLSAAVHELNTGNAQLGTYAGTNLGAPLSNANVIPLARTPSAYGWAVQGGLKVSLPFLAAGDGFYLQGSYGRGAGLYTGYMNHAGPYAQSATAIEGAPFIQSFSDATLNPFTNRLELSTSFTTVASLLHYWSPEWRSALFGSYGELAFAGGARAAQGSYFGLTATGPGTPGTRFYALSQTLRDTWQYVVGSSLIWSPVRDLDVGVEGMYTRLGVQNGRVLDLNRGPGQSAAYVNDLSNPVRTVQSADIFQIRARVQRDF